MGAIERSFFSVTFLLCLAFCKVMGGNKGGQGGTNGNSTLSFAGYTSISRGRERPICMIDFE